MHLRYLGLVEDSHSRLMKALRMVSHDKVTCCYFHDICTDHFLIQTSGFKAKSIHWLALQT